MAADAFSEPDDAAGHEDLGVERITVPALPEAVRARVVSLATEALGSIPAESVPAPLRRIASFAPGRRARAAATPMAVALEDDDFRRRVDAQVRLAHPELAALASLHRASAADPVDVASTAYLLRPDDWVQTLRAAMEQVERREQTTESGRGAADARHVSRQLEQSRTQLREERQRHREQLASLKKDNAELRRRIATHRQRIASAEADAGAQTSEAQAVRDAAGRQVANAEAEARRLRARVTELEAESATLRRAERESRTAATVRARVLLDTLVDAASGLRRELALPPVDVLPADPVSARERPVSTAATRSLPADDPTWLKRLLELPKVHLVVDGYNVTKLAWPELSLSQQRTRLMRELAPVAARSGAEVTVVFDGADLGHTPTVKAPRGVRVRFSPPGVIADDVIRDLVAAEPADRAVAVVSTDREVAEGVRRSGAQAVESAALVRLLRRS
ncbi:MAG: NYN domain-containing protein [Nocardioidaceae bacterium]